MIKRLVAGILSLTAMLLGFAPSASAYTELSISQSDPLAFGKLAASGASGSVTISPSGTRVASGGVFLVNSDQGQAGAFAVSGDATATSFSITVSPSSLLSNGSATMTLDSFVTDPPIGMNGTLTNGKATLYVGGTLHVGANQPSGHYTGSYSVTVDYY